VLTLIENQLLTMRYRCKVAVIIRSTSTEEGGYVFTSVCLSTGLSVRRTNEKFVNGF